MPKLLNFKKPVKSFEILNKTETEAEIFIYGSIGDDPWDDSAISEKQIATELRKLPKTIKNISIRVNSGGGSVFSGTTIYELLKSHPAKVTAYVEGLAASIASIIIMAADEIVMGEGALIMLHKPLVGIYGNANELEKMIEVLDKIENQMINIYAKRMKASRTEISKILAEETWFTAEEALDIGLAERTFDSGESVHIAASMIQNCTWMKNKPKIKTQDESNKEKLKELTNKVNLFLNSRK